MGPPGISHAEETDIQDKIIYDIMVDRFNNGTLVVEDEVDVDDPYAYNGGDIRGIIKKLDHIKSLGINAIQLSPIMENASNGFHGYWITDMYEIEPLFGTKEDFEELIEEAHKRNIDVYMEFVMNYVSEDHPMVTDTDKKDWVSEPDMKPTDASFWLEDVKQLNVDQTEVASYIEDVADFWMDEFEIDGFVLHAVDQSPLKFIEELTAHIKEKSPEFMLLATFLDEEADMAPFVDIEGIDAVENYAVYEKLNEVFAQVNTPMSEIMDVWDGEVEEKSLLFVDTFNTPRFSYTTAEQSRSALTTWKLALTFMYTSPGTPVVIQGSELPMYGPTFLESQYLVPFNSSDPDLEEFYHRISALKREFPVLKDGDFEQIIVEEGLSVFKRSNGEEKMYIAINNDDTMREATITDDIGEGNQLHGLFSDMIVRKKDDELTFEISRETAEVFIIEEDLGVNWTFILTILAIPIIFAMFVFYVSKRGKTRNL